MACKIFDEIGLFKAFDIQIDKFINFFTALESGYIDLPCKFWILIFRYNKIKSKSYLVNLKLVFSNFSNFTLNIYQNYLI